MSFLDTDDFAGDLSVEEAYAILAKEERAALDARAALWTRRANAGRNGERILRGPGVATCFGANALRFHGYCWATPIERFCRNFVANMLRRENNFVVRVRHEQLGSQGLQPL